MREEGGTPSIVGSIRAGLAMQLKEAVGSDRIMRLEEELCRFVMRGRKEGREGGREGGGKMGREAWGGRG